MKFGVRSFTTMLMSATLSGAVLLAPVVVSPARAAACTPASTMTWTGDGSDGSVSGTTYTVLEFSTAGSCDWTVPDGVHGIAAFAVGGGGGGAGGSGSHLPGSTTVNSGAAGSGGGGAQYASASGSVTPGQVLSIVVGAGGTRGGGGGAGTAGVCGGTGGTSAISDISLSAVGGQGGIGGGQNSTCTAADHKDANGYFLPGNGGDSGAGMTGGSPSAPQAGQGASVSANGGASTALVPGQSVSYAGITRTYANGGGGGSRGANYGVAGTTAGSGGGGGREPLYSTIYWYGYAGSAGVGGTVIVRYIPPISGSASSPASIVLGEAVPTITYTTSPATTAADWTTEPTCDVYSSSDLTSPLREITAPGTYVTQCSGGQLANGGSATFTTGTLTVDPLTVNATSPSSMKVGDPLPEITFTTLPAGYTATWTTEPTCAIYAAGDVTTPVTTITEPGTYVTHCTGGELSNGATDFTFEDGTFVVTAADNGGGGGGGGWLVNTGWALATTLTLFFMSGLMFLGAAAFRGAKGRLIAAGEDARLSQVLRVLNARLARLERSSRRR